MIRAIEDGEIVTTMRAKLRSLAMTQRRLSHQFHSEGTGQ